MDASKHSGSKLCWNCNGEDTAGAGLAANFRERPRAAGTVHIHDLISSYPSRNCSGCSRRRNFQGWTLLEEGSATADPLRVMQYYPPAVETMAS